jgi:hypothetical protein
MKPNRTLAALLLHAALAFATAPTLAHGDEDHSQDRKTPAQLAPANAAVQGSAAREAPSRLPDGQLFVPKAVQRQLGIRTQLAKPGELAATVEMNGRIVALPGAGGRMQATQAGSVVAAGKAFPEPGRRVQPIVSSLERSGQRALQAELAAQLTIAQRRAARLQQLEGSVPAKEIESARVEAQALQQRIAAVEGGIDVPQALRAPADGVISSVAVVAGEMVDAKAVLFEIVDPARLGIEALAYDSDIATRIVGAEALAGERKLPLQLVGGGLQLRDQALPLLFRIGKDGSGLAIGQPVKVFARLRSTDQGVALPRSALWRNAAGETLVWVHDHAERFTPRPVRQQPLDATSVAVLDGLKPGDRVVIAGAGLLAQVR